ncbi:MAG: ATP-binding protein [Thermodesulfobacteriota bacterium]
MKYTYKLFASFLATSLMIVILMVTVLQYYASRNFSAYVGWVEMEQLGDIMPRLEQEYRDHNGWEHLRDNPETWSEILRQSPGKESPVGQPPPRRERPAGCNDNPPPPPRGDNQQLPPRNGNPPPPPRDSTGGRDDNPPAPAQDHLSPPPHDIRPRLTLFDRDKKMVVGQGSADKDHVLMEIPVDGQVAGWLGLKIPERLSDPLQMDFLYRQTRAIYLIGGVILVLSSLLTFLLARGLMQPIRRLTEGARALASRRFDTRIKAGSGDEMGQLASDFNHMADTLERYDRLRRQWLSDISHELRTPLSVLLAEIDAVLDGVRDMSRQTLESIHAEVLLLAKLVEDLHALSLLESDALTLARGRVDVLKVARDVLQAFELRCSQAGITVESRLTAKTDMVITGDAARLAQVFGNLLENTLKYTDSPGRLRVSHVVKDGQVHLLFEDSPPAVSPGELPYIFERLYRTDRSRSTGGSGLGLAICKTIIEAGGGSIRSGASALGGLKIEIALPLTRRSMPHTEKRS